MKIGKFDILTNFYVIYDKGKPNLSIILSRPFLVIGVELIGVIKGKLIFHIYINILEFQVANVLKVPPIKTRDHDVKRVDSYPSYNTHSSLTSLKVEEKARAPKEKSKFCHDLKLCYSGMSTIWE